MLPFKYIILSQFGALVLFWRQGFTMTSNLRSSCLSLPWAGVADMGFHTHCVRSWGPNPGPHTRHSLN